MNIDSIEVGGHTISFEIRSNEKGNKEIWAICDRTARILSVELNKRGKLVHSIEKGAKGTLFETKAILGGVATREEGPMNFEGKKVGTFEHHEIKDGFGRISTKNISKFNNDLEVEEEINPIGVNEVSYIKKVNGIPCFSMKQTNEGVVLTRYDRDGNMLADYSYDKNGKTIGRVFPGVPGYETLDNIDMSNPYMFPDLIQNDFIQDIGIPYDMRNMVQDVEKTRYKETPMVSKAKSIINEKSKTIAGDKQQAIDER